MPLSPFELEVYFTQYEFTAPYLLCASDCETFSIDELLALETGAAAAFAGQRLGYTEAMGHPALRAAIASQYESIMPEEVLVHSGAEEAIFAFMHATLQRGDHLIVHYPGYQSFFEVARSLDCEVTLWTTHEADGWELDLDVLKQHLRPTTRAVIINCPHNPTGYLMSREKLDALNALSQEHGFLLFSDEVYRALEYREEDRLPAACDLSAQGVSLGVMSKAFGLAGLRIGWIATKNAALLKKQLGIKHYLTICNSAPSEFLATLALRHSEMLLRRNRKIIADNLEVLNAFFTHHQDRFIWHPPKAGPIAFPSLRQEENSAAFCHDLVTRTGVLLLPGTVYDPGSSHFRIGFGRLDMPDCLERLEHYLLNYAV